MTDKRDQQYQADAAALVNVLREYQHGEGHCRITVQVQNGVITMIEDTQKRKPPKV